MAHCTRCRGRGFRDTPRAHYDIPGLCFDCHGDGTRETQLKTQADVRERRRLELQSQAVMERIQATAEQHGGRNLFPSRDRRHGIKMYEEFTTADYAAKFGLDLKAAFVELCRWAQCYPVLNKDGHPTAWVRG